MWHIYLWMPFVSIFKETFTKRTQHDNFKKVWYWNLDAGLKYFLKELLGKEASALLNKKLNEKNYIENNYTSGFLYTEICSSGFEKSQDFVFCYKPSYPPSQCKTVTNAGVRIDVLERFSKCFLCLRSRNTLKDCYSKFINRKCMGKHHVSICKFDENDDAGFGVVPHVYSNKTVLL